MVFQKENEKIKKNNKEEKDVSEIILKKKEIEDKFIFMKIKKNLLKKEFEEINIIKKIIKNNLKNIKE